MDWKAHKSCCGIDSNSSASSIHDSEPNISLLPEYEVVIEEEVLCDSAEMPSTASQSTEIWEDAGMQ